MNMRKAAVCLMMPLILFSGMPSSAALAQPQALLSSAAPGYEQYLAPYAWAVPAESFFTVPARDALDMEGALADSGGLQGREGALSFPLEESWALWQVDVPQDGLYAIALEYLPLPGRNRDIEVSLQIDGETWFAQMEKLVLPRIWKDDGPIGQDNRGNDVRPQKVEARQWRSLTLRDPDGMYPGNFSFYLTQGMHALRLTALGEPFALASITLWGEKPLPTYEEAFAAAQEAHPQAQTAKERVDISAEAALETSSPVLYPIADRSGPATETRGERNSLSKNRLNAIGGVNWKFAGQWISWAFEAPQDGFYQIAFKARQNFSRGMLSSREIRLDGQVPFVELACVEIPYGVDWQMIRLGRETREGFEPYWVYLDAGKHELAMEVAPGRVAPLLRATEQTVLELNTLYRKIIMITGTSPDPYQDYYLERKVPGLLEAFGEISARLKAQVLELEALTGVRGSEASLLEEVYTQLDSMIKKPDTIPTRLERLKDNIGSMGAWILQLKEQPLELDYLVLMGEGTPESAQADFLSSAAFTLGTVAVSFFEDQNAIGNVYDDRQALSVWISQQDLAAGGSSSGRDQALIIKRLIDDSFTAQTGIPVNLNLVDSSQTLVQAVMGGKGPDVALTLSESTPINLAMRGALYDLSSFPEYKEVAERFEPSALVAYGYQGGAYALPETQTFNMLFYRSDIFEELGLESPDTWEQFYRVMKVLQKNNLQVGVPEQQSIFEMFLFQHGGRFYAPDLRSTGLDQPQALEAFSEWTGLYSNHGLPLSFDFYNRFRTGEMPMGIAAYSFYNTLSVAAPELRGLWRMAPVPGTPGEDGSLNRGESCFGTAAVLLDTAKDPQAGWEFLKWWTSAQVQSRYGLELEYLIGPAARYNTANKEAFETLPWKAQERESLLEQRSQVWDVEQLPGNYFTDRNIQFAFRRVVYYYENQRETLFEYNKEINKEIVRKRQEFGLE
ncbi:MAG: extracellular solute-binding protein [Candidatus Limiplasma sp.]|nr:extracellular solute-binding protein [Candidatus Limiplasma sp.]